MQKFIFIIAILLLSDVAESQVRMGLTASPQISWMTSDAGKVSSDGVQMGFVFGLVTDFFFADRYSVSTGVMVNNTGGRLNYADSLSFEANDITYELKANTDIKYKVQYIDVPLNFRMESNQIGYFVYYAQLGITNHFMVGATTDIKNSDISLVGVSCKEELSFYNMSYNIGIGSDYYLSKNTAITFGVMFTNGLLDATNNEGMLTPDNVSLKSIALKLGVLF